MWGLFNYTQALNRPVFVDNFLREPEIRTIFSFYPLFITTSFAFYCFYIFLGEDDERTGGIFCWNLSSKKGNTVIWGGKNAAWTAFYLP